MPEGRQIGRGSAIDSLQARLDEATHQWMIGERRIGKTSVAKAVLARQGQRGSVALDVDLTRNELTSSERLAGEIARQAQAAQVGDASAPVKRVLGIARRQRGTASSLGAALRELGFEDGAAALDAAAALLASADDGAPGLNNVLAALALRARATERRAFVLLDEVHLLAALPGAEEQVARWCREPDSPIVFIFAGSEEAAARALRENGRPLIAIGREFKLPAIAPEDWVPGLRGRFREGRIEIADEALEEIVAASGGHPRRTMLIAANVQTSVGLGPDNVATGLLVEVAIREAKADRAWR